MRFSADMQSSPSQNSASTQNQWQTSSSSLNSSMDSNRSTSSAFADRLEQKQAPSERTDSSQRSHKKKDEKKDEKIPLKEKPQEKMPLRLREAFHDPINNLERQLMAMLPPGASGLSNNATSVQSAQVAPSTPRISEASLNQIVERTRVGVNESGDSMFQIDLKGDVLDGLQIKIACKDGKIHAQFLSEKPEIRQMLSANEQLLQKAMRDKGLILERLETKDPKEEHRQRQQEQHQRDRQQAW